MMAFMCDSSMIAPADDFAGEGGVRTISGERGASDVEIDTCTVGRSMAGHFFFPEKYESWVNRFSMMRILLYHQPQFALFPYDEVFQGRSTAKTF